MSIWTYFVAETRAPDTLTDSVDAVLAPYKNSARRYDPVYSSQDPSLSRVRLGLGKRLMAPNNAESPPPHAGEELPPVLKTPLTDGTIAPYQWAVVVHGNDTANAGFAEVFYDNEHIDTVPGREGRFLHDIGAYLERLHGVRVYPMPQETSWPDAHEYTPGADLPDTPPDRTIADEPPSSPFEFGARHAWLRVVADTTNKAGLAASLQQYRPAITERPPAQPTDTRVRFDFASTVFEHGIGRYTLWEDFFQGEHADAERAVLIAGGDDSSRADLFDGREHVDTVFGEGDYYGADLERYLAHYHDLHVNAMPTDPPDIPDEVPLPDETPM